MFSTLIDVGAAAAITDDRVRKLPGLVCCWVGGREPGTGIIYICYGHIIRVCNQFLNRNWNAKWIKVMIMIWWWRWWRRLLRSHGEKRTRCENYKLNLKVVLQHCCECETTASSCLATTNTTRQTTGTTSESILQLQAWEWNNRPEPCLISIALYTHTLLLQTLLQIICYQLRISQSPFRRGETARAALRLILFPSFEEKALIAVKLNLCADIFLVGTIRAALFWFPRSPATARIIITHIICLRKFHFEHTKCIDGIPSRVFFATRRQKI